MLPMRMCARAKLLERRCSDFTHGANLYLLENTDARMAKRYEATLVVLEEWKRWEQKASPLFGRSWGLFNHKAVILAFFALALHYEN